MTSNIYITPRTSLVLIKSLAQETNIYMSTYNVPDFQVNIRDATGSPTIATNPISICTINGARFTNNTTTYKINQPFGFVNVSLRTSTLWQVLHTSGQTPESSAANVTTTNFSTVYFGFASTAAKYVSTLRVENIETPNTIQLTGPFIIGNLSSPGFVQFKSTFNVYGDVRFDTAAYVSGATLFKSSLSLQELTPLSSIFRTYGDLETQGSVYVIGSVNVFSTLQTASTLQVTTLDVQLSSIDVPVVFTQDLQVGGVLSTLGNFNVVSNISVMKNITVTQTVSSLSGVLSLGSSLTVLGRLFALSSLSTNDQTSVTRFESSLTLQSSLGVQTNFSTLSSAFVTSFVSSGLFQTNLLSSGTSFSTAGDFSVLSTLTVKGNLSTNLLRILNTLSIGTDLVTSQSISTTESAELQDTSVLGSAFFNSIDGTRASIKGSIRVEQSTLAKDLQIEADLRIRDPLQVRSAAYFGSNMGVATDVRVLGDILPFGNTTINNPDVGSYGLSTLFVTTSSPYFALRVSTLEVNSLTSEQAKFVYTADSGSITLLLNSSIQGDLLYANSTQMSKLSTLKIFTNSVLPNTTSLSVDSAPKVDIPLRSGFLESFSTTFIQANSIVADEFRASFIGDGSQLPNVSLYFSTVSANTVWASSIQTKLFSSARINLGSSYIDGSIQNAIVDRNLSIDRYSVFQSLVTNPCLFISSGGLNLQDEYFQIEEQIFGGLVFGKIETLNSSTLNVNNTLFIDSQSRRVGVMTSTPQYDFDISGSLYFSGELYLSTFSPAALSTTKPVVSFSTIYYSSISIRDSVTLPPGIASFRATSTPAITLVPSFIVDETNPFLIANRVFPIPIPQNVVGVNFIFPGIYTNSNYSTLDIGLDFYIYNSNKNVGIGTSFFDYSVVGIASVTPSNIPNYDLVSVYAINATEVLTSSVSLFTKLKISSFITPTFGIFPNSPSTLNTVSSDNLSTIKINQFVDLYKDTTLKGYFQIKRSPVFDAPFKALFSVYNDAYISSISVKNLVADTISCGFQDL